MEYLDIISQISVDIDRVKQLMYESLHSDIELLFATNKSLLNNGGKFIRPVLCVLVAKACCQGECTDDTIKYAASLELLHNATLFHDDVADNSLVRRGNPTIMSLLGAKYAVLLGDYWLVKSMFKILEAENNKIEAIKVFSGTIGDLVEGEMLQLEKASECNTNIDDYLRIIYYKTASLFVTSAHCGALSVNANDAYIEAVKGYAKNVGLAFQIKDDILDYVGENIGKPVCQDIRERKVTLPLLEAFEEAGSEKEKEIRTMLKDMGSDDNIEYIYNFVIENNGIQRANKKLDYYVNCAVDCLAELPDSTYKDSLKDLAFFIVGRNN